MNSPLESTSPAVVEALARRYLQAQLAGNRREAVRLVLEEGLAAGLSVKTLQTRVIRWAQDEIGRLWQQNRISVAQEHMASAITLVALSRLFEAAPPSAPLGKKLVVACVEGELHDLPSRLVADFLELEGFEVRYLGASVPTDDLINILRAEKPDLVALSVTMSFNVPSLRVAVTRIRKELSETLPLLVGGHAVRWAPGLLAEFGVKTAGSEPEELAQTARELLSEAAS